MIFQIYIARARAYVCVCMCEILCIKRDFAMKFIIYHSLFFYFRYVAIALTTFFFLNVNTIDRNNKHVYRTRGSMVDILNNNYSKFNCLRQS